METTGNSIHLWGQGKKKKRLEFRKLNTSEEGVPGVKHRSMRMPGSGVSEGRGMKGLYRIEKSAGCIELLSRDGTATAVKCWWT